MNGLNNSAHFIGESIARKAAAVVREMFYRRRLLPGESERSVSFDVEAEPHIRKVQRAIEQNLPVHMVLPAFPAKSPNRRKTLGPLPDGGRTSRLATSTICASAFAPSTSPGRD